MSVANEHEQDERCYLHTWLATLQNHWDAALYGVAQRAYCLLLPEMRLLLLAEQASQLGYPEEASGHLRRCLMLLNERRVNVPEVRLLAYLCQGHLALHTHQCAQATLHFETARALYHPDILPSTVLGAVLTGLCAAALRQGHYDQACSWGQQALDLLPAGEGTAARVPLLLLLSRGCLALHKPGLASTYAREAKALASSIIDQEHLSAALLLLAEGYLEAGQPEGAQRACEQVLALASASQSQPRGMAYWLLGQVAEKHWQHQPAAVQNVVASYEEAQRLLQDPASLAKGSQHLAQVLEGSGRPERALAHWKQAYQFALTLG